MTTLMQIRAGMTVICSSRPKILGDTGHRFMATAVAGHVAEKSFGPS